MFLAGPLTGTNMPGATCFQVIAKSPLTGIFGQANAAGIFAPQLKHDWTRRRENSVRACRCCSTVSRLPWARGWTVT